MLLLLFVVRNDCPALQCSTRANFVYFSLLKRSKYGAFSVFYADPRRKKRESIKRKEKEEESKKKREGEEEGIGKRRKKKKKRRRG